MRLLTASLLLFASLAAAATCPARDTWPTADGWKSQPVDATARATELKALEDYLFTLQGKDADRLGLRTDSLLIIKHGVLVYERYARGYDATKRHISWSVGKSISSALIGVAVQSAGLDLNASICTVLTEYSGAVCDITVKDVITFSPGLQWQEDYEHDSYQTSSVISMLLGEGHKDMVKFVLSHKKVAEPGSEFVYSTGTAHVLATIAKRKLEPAFGADAFWTQLFDRLGMSRVVFEEDPAGNPLGGSYVFATPRDFARFGYLYLNDGCWNGTRILPEGWVTTSTTPSDPFIQNRPYAETESNGYMWWTNAAIPSIPLASPWVGAPVDTYSAIGHWGQYITVVPSQDLLIVRTGDDRNDSVDIGKMVQLSMAVAP
jgi:CubicO group peptidase (beta-lactamase class C family)